DSTPPEIMAYRESGTAPNSPGWRVRVVPNLFPALQIEGELDKRGEGIYDRMNGIGAHEVIIETPKHALSLSALSNENVEEVLWTYRDRLVDLKKDKRFTYGMIFKNVGVAAGASLEHTHSQLIVTPTVPKIVTEEMKGAQDFYGYRGRCIFCDMVEQELSAGTRVVLEGERFVAFAPFASRFPFETWLLPKRHASHFENLQKLGIAELAVDLKTILAQLEKALDYPPYNYIIHTAPFDVGDLAHYHWHIEIIPRLTRIAGFEWGTGFYINPVAPEDAAEYQRTVELTD
ncbi:MAG: galactose-1-phosphate uridylyltransferase, partial [Planctomycetes bacterium]|nr:galactose-1-phosphate uridylyltransferase [Planctomycetota bacterium]